MSFEVEKLPKTMSTYILSFIPDKEIYNIARVSKYMNSLINDLFWTIKILRLRNEIPKYKHSTLKDIYIWSKHLYPNQEISGISFRSFDVYMSIPKPHRKYHTYNGEVVNNLDANRVLLYYGINYSSACDFKEKDVCSDIEVFKKRIENQTRNLNEKVIEYLFKNINSIFYYRWPSN